MTESKESYSLEDGIRRVKFKGEKDVYEFPLLSVKQMNVLFPKLLALISPVLAAGYETYKDQSVPSDEDDYESITEDQSLLPLATIIGNQLYQPEVQELLDSLVPELKKNGEDTDLDSAFKGQYDKYLKLVEQAFKDNFSVPLGRLLEEKGFAGMLTSLLAAMNDLGE